MKGTVKKKSRRLLAMLMCVAMLSVLVPAPLVQAQTDSSVGNLGTEHLGGELAEAYATSCPGHNYTSVTYGATCQTYAHTQYTCVNCGDSYNVYPEENMSDWQTEKPNVDESIIETATQYRSCTYETVTSYDNQLEDYERVGSQWVMYDQNAVYYVNEWPAGFDTTNSLYNKYDNLAQKVSNASTEMTRVEVNSDQLAGYLYYHWCYSGYAYTSATKTGSYNRFHAYYSTALPSSANASDPSDDSYRFDGSTACSDSKWYFAVPVYAQTYTTYRNLFTYRCWGEATDWSFTPVEATQGRQVETRTVYRYVTGGLGAHNYVNNVCTVCGESKGNADYYLFGYINGKEYGCEGDYQNMGTYKFVNGKLTATFTQDSYVAVKTEGNTNWYMTEGWQGEVSSVTLYNTNSLNDANKLYVPGGAELEFTLVVNSNDTLTLSYAIRTCAHNYQGKVTTAASCLNSGQMTYTCTICGHSYIQNIPATGHSAVSVVTKPTCTEGGYTTYTCSTCGYSYIGDRTAAAGHNYSSTIVPNTCTEVGHTLYSCGACGSSYKTDYTAATGHSFVNGSCSYCGATDPNYSVTDTGFVLVTDISQITSGGKFVIVANNSGTYQAMDTTVSSGKFAPVTVTVNGNALAGSDLPVWTVEAVDGGIAISLDGSYLAYNSSTNFKMDTTAYAWTVAAGDTGFILNAAATSRGIYYSISAAKFGAYATSNSGSSSYISNLQLYKYQGDTEVCSHSYTSSVTTAATCTTAGVTTYTCTKCAYSYTQTIAALGHNYASGYCFNCGGADPNYSTPVTTDYYLIGWINGADHGCEGDWENPGNYKFTNGKLTATFNQDSYVFVKTGDNSKWLLATSYCTDTSCTFVEGGTEKMFVPGNVQLTFTLVENANGSVTVSYSTGASTVPTLTLKAPTLEFKDTITVNAFYTAENTADVVEMGMITYSTKVTAWSVETAEHVIPGAEYEATSGRYFSKSQGIFAKYLGDTVYLAVYAKLSDGTYAYSKLASYSAIQYATSQLKNSTDAKLKQLVVAMLSYGAEAQLYFGHNTSALANASLTAEQKALPAAYSASMISAVSGASTAKQGSFVNNQGFASRKPAISFEGAFCINYFFTPNYAPVSGITLYYWNATDYNAASVLTTANATGSLKLSGSGTGEYRGDIEGIAAKAISEAVYVAAAYKDSSGTVWTSGVLGYSIGSYCSSQASKGGDIAALAKATAVYGYHAKQYFG